MATTNLAPLFAKGITKHYLDEMQAVASQYEKLFHVETMDGAYSDDQLWELYTGPQPRLPLMPVAQGQISPSFNKRYLAVSYALGDVIAKEYWEDDPTGTLHRVLAAKGGALARAFATSRERVAAEMFMFAGYGTAPVAGSPDGQPLFSTAHPVSKDRVSTTASNRPSATTDLSYSAFMTARNNLVQQMAPNDYTILQNRPRILVVNPNLHAVAYRIANQEWEPDSTTRNVNVIRLDRIQVVEWPYFRHPVAGTTFGSWFVIGETHFLKWFNRKGFELESDYDINVQAFKFVGTERFTCGWTDWRGTYGAVGS